MKLNKKMSLLALVSVLLTGCGGVDDTNYKNDPWDPEYVAKTYSRDMITKPIDIVYSSANSAIDVHGSRMNELVDKFNALQKVEYPNSYIKVEAQFQGGYDAQNTKLQAQLMGGTNPEIAQIGVSSTPIYYKNAVDMRDILAIDSLKDIQDGFLQFAMYHDKFVGYPFYSATNVLLVNKELFQAKGITLPSPQSIVDDPENSQWTWDYMKEKAGLVSDTANNVYGLGAATMAAYESFYTQGVSIYNKNATEINFNNEYGTKAFTYWRSLVKDDVMKNPILDPNHANIIVSDFTKGKIGLLSTTSSQLLSFYNEMVTSKIKICQSEAADEAAKAKCVTDIKENNELDVLPYPKDKTYYSNQSGGTMIVFNNKSDEKIAASREFLKWLSSPEIVAEYSSTTGYLPVTKGSLDTKIWSDFTSTKTDLLENAVKLMKFTPPVDQPLPLGRAKALADKEFSNYSKSIWYDNLGRSIEDCLKETSDRVQYILTANSY